MAYWFGHIAKDHFHGSLHFCVKQSKQLCVFMNSLKYLRGLASGVPFRFPSTTLKRLATAWHCDCSANARRGRCWRRCCHINAYICWRRLLPLSNRRPTHHSLAYPGSPLVSLQLLEVLLVQDSSSRLSRRFERNVHGFCLRCIREDKEWEGNKRCIHGNG